jgi:hypothetical protein
MGRRISVVLVGEDSLEANVGYLAALTGGDIFVSGGADIGSLLEAAIGSLRRSGGTSSEKAFLRSGMMVTVNHDSSSTAEVQTLQGRAVAAAAVSFLLPTLSEEQATKFAEREGIVSHLTSLVLVDEAGATQEKLPGQRPVALPPPATDGLVVVHACRMAPSAPAPLQRPRRAFARLKEWVPNFAPRRSTAIDLARKIDWASEPGRLIAGDLSQLAPDLRKALLAIARKDVVKQAASTLGMPPLLLVIALLALQVGNAGDRAAARIAHRLLAQFAEVQIRQLTSLLEE